MEHWIDHLVLAVPSLDEGIAAIAETTGVEPVRGGAHPGGGTHNALLSLGSRTYLEVIAPDPDQPDVSPRAFGVDERAEQRLTAFAVGCADIDATVATLRGAGHDGAGEPFSMSRRRPDGSVLSWRLAMIDERVGATHPFLISWDGGASPASDSPDGGRLVALRGGDPDPTARATLLQLLGIDVVVEPSDDEWLAATIDAPAGRVTLR